jgi:hypothetical protein
MTSDDDRGGIGRAFAWHVSEEEEETDWARLRTLAAERDVGYEVWRDDTVVGEEIVHTGLNVELLAPSKHVDGCQYSDRLACPAVFADLATIARAVLPRAIRDSAYSLDGFDHSLHIDPHRHFEGDVRVTVHVRHRDGSRGSIDDCQRECVREISSALERIGARRRSASVG